MAPGLELALASASPRRRQFLAEWGLPFRVVRADAREPAPQPGEAPAAYTCRAAAAKAMPHPLKGEGIYAYVVTRDEVPWSAQLRVKLRDAVRRDIGALASPEYIQFVDAMPKTTSGKIIRRMLRKIAGDSYDDIGDATSLAEPEVLEKIISGHCNLVAGRHETENAPEGGEPAPQA